MDIKAKIKDVPYRIMSATKMINETAAGDILDFTKALDVIEENKEKSREELFKDLKYVHFSMQNKLSPVLLGLITEETDASEIDNYEDLLNYIHRTLDMLREFSKEKIQNVTGHEIAAVISGKTGIPMGIRTMDYYMGIVSTV